MKTLMTKVMTLAFAAALGLVSTSSLFAGTQLDPIDPRMDFALTSTDGVTKTLSAYFTREYLLIDFSRYLCGGCQTMAKSVNADVEFQKLVEHGKCNYVILTPKGGLSDWINWIGATSFVAKHSYQPPETDYMEVAKEAFDYELNYVPVLLLIDRNRNILGELDDQNASLVKENCVL